MDASVEEDSFRIDQTAPATLAAAVLEESKGTSPKELLVSVGDNIAVQEENYLKCVPSTLCTAGQASKPFTAALMLIPCRGHGTMLIEDEDLSLIHI